MGSGAAPMADDPKTGNFANNSIILAALVSTGALIFNHYAPLNAARPQSREPQVHETASAQDVDARLWQDPFAVAARAVEKLKPDCAPQSGKANPHCLNPIDQLRNAGSLGQDESPLVVGVTVSGAPYAEDEEARRRLRYAVVSALDVLRFAPDDERHIGLWKLAGTDAPGVAALPAAVPFELFDQQSTEQKILVLWLDEDMATRQPLSKVIRLLDRLNLAGMQIIGPRSSGTLRDMVNEAMQKANPGPTLAAAAMARPGAGPWGRLGQTTFYAYGATVQDSAIMPDKSTTIHSFLKSQGITLYRTIATDDVLARALVHELKLRGVEPGKAQRAHPGGGSDNGEQHVALISEWDTFYGQMFPATMQACLVRGDAAQQDCPQAAPDQSWIHTRTYLRGLDGALPQAAGDDGKKPDAESKATGDKDAKDRLDGKPSELAAGQGQYDYLRRLADDLNETNEELQRNAKGSIKAIGVLGGDVFDKLLVLRALRPQFPEAVFFTNDFDALLTKESELKWTSQPYRRIEFRAELDQLDFSNPSRRFGTFTPPPPFSRRSSPSVTPYLLSSAACRRCRQRRPVVPTLTCKISFQDGWRGRWSLRSSATAAFCACPPVTWSKRPPTPARRICGFAPTVNPPIRRCFSRTGRGC